ncbi:unnamed protein product [Prunus armeniaca]
MDRACGSVTHPPFLDENTNYGAWKAKMKSFLWAQGTKVWTTIENGWEPPTKEIKGRGKEVEGEGQSTTKVVIKQNTEWTDEENDMSAYNQKGLNSIFTAVSAEKFEFICHCKTSKEAWDILEITHEGNATVRESKLQQLMTKFENLKMLETEKFAEFYARLSVVVNACSNLGDAIPEHRIVKKILRSLPMMYHAKKTAIEECKNLNTYKLTELIGSLTTYEMEFPEIKKSKGIALNTVKEDESDSLSEDKMDYALLTKQFRKFLKSKNSRSGEQRGNSGSSTRGSRPREFTSDKLSHTTRTMERKGSKDSLKCFECGGYGHFASECANNLRKQNSGKNKVMAATWSDSESDNDSNSENEDQVVAFSGRIHAQKDENSDVEEPEIEVVMKQFNNLYDSSEKLKKKNAELVDQVAFLQDELTRTEAAFQSQLKTEENLRGSLLEKIQMLQDKYQLQKDMNVSLTFERDHASAELKLATEKIFGMTIGAEKIDRMLSLGKRAGDTRGLGFESEKSKQEVKAVKFIKEFSSTEAKVSPKKFIPICHFCGVFGHIRPRCNVLRKEKRSAYYYSPRNFNPSQRTKLVWKKKEEKCLVTLMALSARKSDTWYFDSGCSRHMSGDKCWFTNLNTECVEGSVTFGDGSKGKILGKGDVETLGLPFLKNVMLVENLQANLISISQLCDDGSSVWFDKDQCYVADFQGKKVMSGMRSKDNCYCIQLSKNECVRGLPKLSGKSAGVCGACQLGKQVKSAHKSISYISTSQPLDLLHMDLVGPIQTESIGGKKYMLVLVDDFTRFTWVDFLREKSDAFKSFRGLCNKIQIEKNGSHVTVMRLRTDHGTEFENVSFAEYCEEKGIKHEFSAPITPQHNGVVERKNRTLLEMGRVILTSAKIAKKFWAEAISTACYTANRVFLRPGTTSTPYELWKGRKPNIKHMRVFGSVCYIYRDRENLAKFDTRSDAGIFLGYSLTSRAYRVFNKRTCTVMESINVVVNDTDMSFGSCAYDDEDIIPAAPRQEEKDKVANINDEVHAEEDMFSPPLRPGARQVQKDHTPSDIIGDLNDQRKTRSQVVAEVTHLCYVSKLEPKNSKEALLDCDWIMAMQEELDQFTRNDVWYLVPRPKDLNVIGTKWVFRNKTDENGVITRNKARLVAQGYSQVEGLDFDETFAPVARLESVRLLLAIACHMRFKLHQMDVKSAFLNGVLQEEVYVEQPVGFKDPYNPDHVYRLRKALYGLKQAPRAWYDRLSSHLLNKGEFEMSMCGELSYFLGLQVKQQDHGIFISQTKYAKDLVKKFGMSSAKPTRNPMATHNKIDADPSGKCVEQTLYRSMIGSLLYLTASRPDISFSVGVCARFQANPKESHLNAVKRIIRYVSGTPTLGVYYSFDSNSEIAGYTDADWAGNVDDRKSTSGGCFYVGNNLVSWHSKKQACVSLSTAEAEYVAAGSCCTQLLWMKQMMSDYGIHQEKQLADLFTKPLDTVRFEALRKSLGICSIE